MRQNVSGESYKRPRLAIVGIGKQGKKLIKAFSPYADIVAYSRRNLPNAEWMKENCEAEERSWDDICNDPSIDGAIVATTIKSLGYLANMAAANGKHVFVEKPCPGRTGRYQTDPLWINQIAKQCKKHNKTFFIGYKFFYGLPFEQFCYYSWDAQYLKFTWTKFGTFDSDILLNLACHDVGMAMYVFGEPVEVETIQLSRHRCEFRILFDNEKYASFNIDRMDKNRQHKVIFGVNGNSYTTIDFSKSDPLRNEARQFVECINGKEKPMITASFASKILNIIRRIEK